MGGGKAGGATFVDCISFTGAHAGERVYVSVGLGTIVTGGTGQH